MSELWGFQSGQQQADETNLKMQMGQLALQEGAVDIKQKETNLKQSQLALQQQQMMMKRLAEAQTFGAAGGGGGGVDPIEGLANQLYAQASAIAPVAPEQAASIVDKASKLELNHSKIVEATQTRNSKMWADAANALQGVHDHASLQEAVNQFTIQHPDEAQNPKMREVMMQLQGQEYDQGKIDAIRNAAIDNKTKAETAAAEARAKASTAAAKRDEAQVPLEKARTEESEARTAALRKAGGNTELPKGTDINYIMQHATEDFDLSRSDADKAKARLQATQVASNAKDILAANPGMSKQQALDKAYRESRKGGNWSGLSPIDKSVGGNPANALPIPQDLKKLQDNRWYIAPDSEGNMVPQLWDGSSFKTRDALNEDSSSEDEPDDEDED